MLTRKLEELLLRLYAEGKIHGTIHTCIGQEFSGAVISEFLRPGDTICSNHRGHGHFLSMTHNSLGLLSEILGGKHGVCGGKGGSQHLCQDGFYSNGIQGGMVPIAAGLALAKKIRKQQQISIVFIGDGTLGEGVIYETFNLSSIWKLPIVFVLENNSYAQSTHQSEVVAGNICARAQAFDIATKHTDTWNWSKLYSVSEEAINYTREFSAPVFLQIDTYRLSAHSKGDDIRAIEEVTHYKAIDPLFLLQNEHPEEYFYFEKKIDKQLEHDLEHARFSDNNEPEFTTLTPLKYTFSNNYETKFIRLGQAINEALKHLMRANEKIYFLGEDVKAPYGGAFKISRELSDLYPNRVFNTPISESAIVGIGIGLALEGFKPIIEIMFGDFVLLALDQIINHAAKFRYMYNDKVRVPLMIRVPMGGGMGYGPTHSQTLDRHLFGIPGLRIVAVNNLMHPEIIYKALLDTSEDPVVVIENKALYTTQLRLVPLLGFSYKIVDDSLPIIIVEPDSQQSDITLIAYGGLSELVIDIMNSLFLEYDIICQFICPTQIYPFNMDTSFEHIKSNKILIIEEGQGYAGFGSEIIAQLYALYDINNRSIPRMMRLFAAESVIPFSKKLEQFVLPEKNKIINTILHFLKQK